MVSPYLFTNIEPQSNSDFFLAVYAGENEDLMEERLKSLSKDTHKLLAANESAKFLSIPDEVSLFAGISSSILAAPWPYRTLLLVVLFSCNV
jgi:hypothetical protein